MPGISTRHFVVLLQEAATDPAALEINHSPISNPYPYARQREPHLLPPMQREWTTTPEVEGVPSQLDQTVEWLPAPNQPYRTRTYQPWQAFLWREWTTTPEEPGVPSDQIDWWHPQPNVPYLRVIRRPYLLPPMPVREWTVTPEAPGVPSETPYAWMPYPNQPYLTVIRHPELLPPGGAFVFLPSAHSTFIEQELGPGQTIAEVLQPSGAKPAGQSTAIEVVSWETHRYLNKIGNWAAAVPAYHELAGSIERGWNLSLVQEDTHPLNRADLEHLLYRGIVEDKRYNVDESGQAVLELAGSFSGLALAQRSTPTTASYNGPIAGAVSGIDGGVMPAITGAVVTPPDGAVRNIDIDFNAGDGNAPISRYSRLLKVGEYARWGLRENWEKDTPEFVPLTTPPDSGYTLVGADAAGTDMQLAGVAKLALIGDTPEIRREGNAIVNRIIPFGSDTVVVAGETTNPPLTLQAATLGSPYTVKTGTNPDASTYWYIEDTDSIARHGLVEVVLQRTDIKNPSDDAGTRLLAANVLYQVASLELQRYRAPKLFVTVTVANGPQIWALPGEMVRMQYTGDVDAGAGVVTWMELDKWFLIIERHDRSTESGVREVTFKLAAPDLPDVLVPVIDPITELPVTDPETAEPIEEPAFPGNPDIAVPPLFLLDDPLFPPGGFGMPAGLGGGWPLGPDCCDDPAVSVADVDQAESPGVLGPGGWSAANIFWNSVGPFNSSLTSPLSPSKVQVVVAISRSEVTSLPHPVPQLATNDVSVTLLAAWNDLRNATNGYRSYRIWLLKQNGPAPSWSVSLSAGPTLHGIAYDCIAVNAFTGVTPYIDTADDYEIVQAPYTATVEAQSEIALNTNNDLAIGVFGLLFNIGDVDSLESTFEFDGSNIGATHVKSKIGISPGDIVNVRRWMRIIASVDQGITYYDVITAAIRLRLS